MKHPEINSIPTKQPVFFSFKHIKGKIIVLIFVSLLSLMLFGAYYIYQNINPFVMLGLFLISCFLIIGFGIALFKQFQKSLKQTAILTKILANGELPSKISDSEDEFSTISTALNQLTEHLSQAISFAKSIGEGNFQEKYKPINERDILGNTLLQTRQKLQIIAEEDRQRSWATEGYAIMGDIIRVNSQDIKILSNEVLIALVEYLGINQGGIFILSEDRFGERSLDLTACYAYNRKKFVQKKITIQEQYAENLVGQVFLEKEKIYVTDIPQDYLSISSGLGEATPSNLLIVPLKFNEQVEGVLELASFHIFQPYQINFIEKVCETIASSVNSVKINERTRKLLDESQEQAKMLQTQEEEMRQNMEELQSTQESMRKAQEELMRKEANLSALINSTDDSLVTVDRNYHVMAINDVLLNRYKGTNYEGINIGANIMEYLGSVKEEWKTYYDRGLAGERYNFVIKSTVNNEDTYRHYFINPIRDPQNNVIGVSTFSRDVTKEKIKEIEQEKLIQELQTKLQMFQTTTFEN